MKKLKQFLGKQPSGYKTQLAAAMKRPPSYLSRQLAGIRAFTADDAIAIERYTKRQVRCEDILPDLNWAFLRKAPRRAAA